jgi:UDP-N-acetyl-D-glucosamine dehydrogenase
MDDVVYGPRGSDMHSGGISMGGTHGIAGVVGLGYVGLPLAILFCEAGIPVIGIDVNEQKIAQIQSGSSPIGDVASEDVARYLESGLLRVSTAYEALRDAACISVCVPTPLRKTKDPDMSYVLSAVEALADVLQDGQLVILESTVYPGATEELIAPLLEREGRRVGKDVFLVFSPERVDPGSKTHTIGDIPKVLGGVTEECARRAAAVYGRIFDDVIVAASAREAEMAKLLENTFRAVNVGLINELAIVADKMGIDIWSVIDTAKTKPFGFMPFYPGPGLGGHCIPIDPFYLSWKAKMTGTEVGFIDLADRINSRMPAYVVERVASLLNGRKKAVNGARIHILGVAYKRDVSDLRESPAIDIIGLLMERGAVVTYSDPHVARLDVPGGTLESIEPTAALLGDVDCTVIVTDHTLFDFESIVQNANLIFDARNATGALGKDAKNVERL